MKLESINPTTEESIGEFEVFAEDMVSGLVEKARQSFRQWKDTDISEREKLVKKFSEALLKNKEGLAELITKEMGKPITESVREIEKLPKKIDWFLKEVRNIIQDEEVEADAEDVSARIRFEPVGVVGIITPWNFPVSNPVGKIIPALLTGNTVVFKPSELSTLCGLRIDEIFKEAGFPEGVFNTITGDKTTGRYLVSSKINMVSMTGSSAAGKDVANQAGKGLKKVVLELGGSDPFVVFDDAIFEQAVNGAVFGRFFNCGQVCIAAKRIIVDRKIYDSFLEKFVQKVKALRVGDPLEKKTEIGPLVSKKQLEKLEVQVKDALEKEVRLLCGGKRLERKGYFYEPTVLTDIKEDMLVAREEVFGPVASIFSFGSVEEAIKIANNTRYGLAASVWTQDSEKAEKALKNIESGTVCVNEFGGSCSKCPRGGIKESGIGRERSKYGVLEFCNMKTVTHSKSKSIMRSKWFPYNESK